MEVTLKLISGICWSTVYLVLIYQGFKHRSYGMPFLALGLNFAWETIYSFYHLNPGDISLQRGINIFWFLFDAIILYQYFVFGKQYFPKKMNAQWFIPASVVVLGICFLIEWMFLMEFGARPGAKYSAFLQNLLMSYLFIDMLLKRSSTKEFSMIVAIAKWIGTLAPTILFGMENSFILAIGLLCSALDIAYIWLLYSMKLKVRS